MNSAFTESTVEEAALAWLESVDWQVAHGPEIAPGMLAAERRDYGEVVLTQRLARHATAEAYFQQTAGEGCRVLSEVQGY